MLQPYVIALCMCFELLARSCNPMYEDCNFAQSSQDRYSPLPLVGILGSLRLESCMSLFQLVSSFSSSCFCGSALCHRQCAE
jgi:hypothetical protein